MTTKYIKPEPSDAIITKFFETEGSCYCASLIGTMSNLEIARRAYILGLKSSKESKSKSRKASILLKHPEIEKDFETLSDLTNPRSVYILGLLWADGNVSKTRNRITISTTHPDLESIKAATQEVGGWLISHKKAARKKQHWKEQYQLIISNPLFKDFLLKYNYGNKSGGSPKEIIESIPAECRKYWFLGYFDGDGSISKDGAVLDLASCYDQNWDFMEDLCGEQNIEFKIERRSLSRGAGSVFRFISYANTLAFCRYIYSGENLGFPRKRERFLKMLEHLRRHNINWNLFGKSNAEKIQLLLSSFEPSNLVNNAL